MNTYDCTLKDEQNREAMIRVEADESDDARFKAESMDGDVDHALTDPAFMWPSAKLVAITKMYDDDEDRDDEDDN